MEVKTVDLTEQLEANKKDTTLLITDTESNKEVLNQEFKDIKGTDVLYLTSDQLADGNYMATLKADYGLIYVVSNKNQPGNSFAYQVYKSFGATKKVNYFHWDQRYKGVELKDLKQKDIGALGGYIVSRLKEKPRENDIQEALSKHELVETLINEDPFTMDSLVEEDLPPINWLVEGMIPEGLGILAGETKAGKSMLLLQLCYCLGNGKKDFLGFKIPKKHNVVYYDFESHKNILQDRINKMYPDDPIPDNVYFYQTPLTYEQGFLDVIEGHIVKHNAGLVIVDMYAQTARTTGVDSQEYLQKYRELTAYKEIAEKFRIAIILVTHTRKKDQRRKVAIEDIMGSQAYTGTTVFNIVIGKTVDCKANDHVINFVESNRAGAGLDLVLRLDPKTSTFLNEGNEADIKEKQHVSKLMEGPIFKVMEKLIKQAKKDNEQFLMVSSTDVLESIPEEERFTEQDQELKPERVGRFLTGNKKDLETYLAIKFMEKTIIKENDVSKRSYKWRIL